MCKNLKNQSWQIIFLYLLLLVGVFCPVYLSRLGNSYYPWFVFTNLFAVLFLVVNIVNKNICIKKDQRWIWFIFLCLIIYNVLGMYINYNYLGLYGSQVNNTISILFFCALISLKDYGFMKKGKIIKFLIKAIVISNVIGIVVYLLGYNGISFRGIPELLLVDPNYYERRFNWIYLHKSQYALMLVLFIAFFVVYREQFHNRGTYFISQAVLIIGLIISHTYTSLCAAMFIFIGQFAEYMKKNRKCFKKKYLLLIAPFIVVGVFLFFKMAKERNILTLGGRVPIWKESFNILARYPNGIGSALGMISFQIPNLSFEVYNCHNYFLNQMLCFSIKVGLSFIVIFISIIILSLRQNISFLTVGIWIALLIPLNMDYAMTPVEFSLFLFIVFCIFWKNSINKNIEDNLLAK